MLRNRPSRVPLGMADVNQMQQRPRLKQASHPLVAQTDRAGVHDQQQNIRIAPQPHYNLREGPQRSRDASVIRLDPNRHVPQFAVYESNDSAEDSDSDETASATFESVARLVHIAEVSPTITQVSGYGPPALVHLPSERPRIHDSHHSGLINGQHQHLSTSLAPIRYRYNGHSASGPVTRSGYSYQLSRQATNHSYYRNSDPRIANLSQRGQNPNAVSFSPRVHFESALQELSPHHRSNVALVNRRGGTLRARPSSSRISHISRGEMNYQTRPRPMPRPRGSLMPRRPSARGARHTGGHLRPPAASSIDTVMDRYPIFPSMLSQSDPPRPDHLFLPRSESIPQGRGILTPPAELSTTRMPYPRSRFSSTTASHTSVQSRASSNSLSATNTVFGLDEVSRYGSYSSGTRDEQQAPHMGSVRSSRVGSWTSLLQGNDGHRSSGLPPTQSPLDRLTQELQRLSTGLSTRSQSSSECTSRVTSTDGHLLSGDALYSDPDVEVQESEFEKYDRPRHRNSRQVDGYNRDRPSSRQPQLDLGMTARILDVEVDCESATIRPLSVSPSSQSVSSTPGIDASLVGSSPPGDLPGLPPTTPGRQLVRSARTPYTPCVGHKPQATPRVRVYDDCQPASMQPQTPADLNHRFRKRVANSPDISATGQTPLPSTTAPPVEQLPVIPARNTHRNTYPSFQQANAQPHLTNSQPSSPYSPNFDLRTAAAITAVERRRTARAFSQENVIDPSTNGMETEREAMWRRRDEDGTNIMDDTPPRQGRYERLISQ
ncbi:unnamed protein product [Aureobasidium uvarum]|uniref:Uncharacterized protein n=1 Tax=Aureobasidium uvarum TaxID=2773716 RepID=A0A9N8KFQ7_9PEZI|nr:unnamed protein product [Aureobasidium uvarum]